VDAVAAAVNVLSLFSGIGGLDLGLERAGMTVAGQVEIDPWCRKVLAKHWPEVPRHDDVRTCVDWWGGRPTPDLMAGGFPCQDVAHVGRRAGLEGKHSGLWTHFAAAIRQLRPRYVLVENSTGLLVRGMGRVLGDLAASGYDASWDCVPAAAVSAPHLRARVWILAYARGVRDEADDALQPGWPQPDLRTRWAPEPAVGRVAHGLPRGMAGRMLRGLGNAVVPQVAEHIGRMILEAAS
jgi:DNA (cytosine-5)-methyltransferase 1